MRPNHKRANKHVFYFVTPSSKDWKLWLSNAHTTSYFLVPYNAFSFFHLPAKWRQFFLSKGKPRTLAATSIFGLLFHISLMHSMGAKTVSTLQVSLMRMVQMFSLTFWLVSRVKKQYGDYYHLYRALAHFKLFATHACAVKKFKGYLKIHTNLKITGKQNRMR